MTVKAANRRTWLLSGLRRFSMVEDLCVIGVKVSSRRINRGRRQSGQEAPWPPAFCLSGGDPGQRGLAEGRSWAKGLGGINGCDYRVDPCVLNLLLGRERRRAVDALVRACVFGVAHLENYAGWQEDQA